MSIETESDKNKISPIDLAPLLVGLNAVLPVLQQQGGIRQYYWKGFVLRFLAVLRRASERDSEVL